MSASRVNSEDMTFHSESPVESLRGNGPDPRTSSKTEGERAVD